MQPKTDTNFAAKFRFKQFSIFKAEVGMPVSTDGVMLGAWTEVKASDKVLDIGTGTGLLSLMLAQRYPNVAITALDIEPSAVEAASFNAEQSPWNERIAVQQADVLQFAQNKDDQIVFDSIICNPPYFISGEQAQSEERATARHCDSLDHRDLLIACERLLNPNGGASFILPTVEGEAFITMAETLSWKLTRLCRIRSTEKKPYSRLLFELTLTKDQAEYEEGFEEESLTIHGDHKGYSEAFVDLTHAFYLKM
ncbi:tRNA1(Val) (adenine(37)-N6)-methyltransferase [Vibrio maerlii]|uniref:tRNA1(Val) (adenine(37)-N6)-methyltransferase n=1 Tax=Vibrio maerlii TaxID=2231648 RepID=UPI000E3BBA20|nr:methyltransferase [Vibrio maerlii]